MQREYPTAPLVGVGAVIIHEGRVALVKRALPPLQGQWSIPGGLLEVGETLREAAIREAYEETGLRVEAGKLLGVFERVLRDERGKIQYHYILIDFLCKLAHGQILAGGDAAAAEWFAFEEIADLALPADTEEVVRLGFAKA